MPYRSAKQRAFMHIKHPDIAAKWDKEYGGTVSGDFNEAVVKNMSKSKKMNKEQKKNAALRKVRQNAEEKKGDKKKKGHLFSNASSGRY